MYSIVYFNPNKVYVSSKACGGSQCRIEWKTYETAHKWLQAFRKINESHGKYHLTYITKDDVIITPEVTAIGGNMLKGYTLYFYNTVVIMDRDETRMLMDKTGLRASPTDFIGLSLYDVLAAIERD